MDLRELRPRGRRPLEEYLLFALMGVLSCGALAFCAGVLALGSLDQWAALGASDTPLPTRIVNRSVAAGAPTPVPTWTPTLSPAAPAPTIVPGAAASLPSGPTPTPTRTRVPAGTYRVQPGDTLLGIAYRAGLTLDDLLAANPNISDPNRLSINQVIRIPEGGSVPVGPPAARPVPVVLSVKGSNINYPQTGSPGGYVPLGAMSVSEAHTVNGKRYPAGSFEYLHGQLHIPFPLPIIAKSQVTLPPPVGAGLCPLTGLPLATTDALQRRPLNARIDNAPAARPQSGLSDADIIYESLAEGGITRFTAIFLCSPNDADIGPIRSARLIDLQLAPMYKAILVHVGASAPVLDLIYASEVGEADFDPVFHATPGFGRISTREAPHNVYSSIGALWSIAAKRGLTGPVDLQGASFSNTPPVGGAPGASVSVPYNYAVTNVGYTYDNGSYIKTIGGDPHIDANTGKALRFANVIILYAQTTYSDALEDGVSSRSLYYSVQGAGRAIILRDGASYQAVWHHEGRNIVFHYTDDAGRVIPLKPGKTMINIVPLELGVAIQ
ncbi:MAG: DUF3048 domain-containing protein [Chloroflexi bacterium]|nr:DUF3048 domain-containing protein [Chloroflexota bacterium]